jgi:cupin 2 domain-containing protein
MTENLFTPPDAPLAAELTETIATLAGARIERIVSYGHASPAGFWYDQNEDEWVAVLTGRARLELADPTESVELHAGDHLFIPAHRKHRVQWTAPSEPTLWLAVFASAGRSAR